MMMRALRAYISLFIFLVAIAPLNAQMLLPRPDPPRLVNDYAGVLSSSELGSLEEKLVAFNDTTSNQIAVVIVNDLQGYDRSEFAFKVARDWGVGQGDFNNGVLVLVKTKSEQSSGQVFIATGYGLEGAIPDIACSDIIDREILPRFRENDYYGGLDAGTEVLMALAAGEYSYQNYVKGSSSGAIPGAVFFIIVIIFIILISSGSSNNRHIKRNGPSNLPLWLLLGMLGGGKSHGGSFGGFSGGRSSGGGFGGGGFGGFGGGSFGGGGAGGSW
jgi:uncharacterized protein